MGLPYNCHLLGVSFVGPILIVGIDGEDLTDVPEPEFVLRIVRRAVELNLGV